MKTHPFRSILFPWVNYLTMAFLVCVLVGMGLNEATRLSLIVGMVFLAVVSLIYRLITGRTRHLAEKIDG